jgi:hypothetical protein
LNEIEKEDSLIRKILTHKALVEKPGTFHIPYLMLVGILYCASNPKTKATKFFEVCQIDLNPTINAGDKELEKFFPKLCEISYDMMISLYNSQHPQEAHPEWIDRDA